MLSANACRKGIMVMLSLLLISACTQPKNPAQKPTRSLNEIKESGTLVVLTRNAPTTYYVGRDGEPTGFENDMVEAFASYMGLKVEYKVKSSLKDIIAGIENAEGDLAAAGLTITDEREEDFLFGPSYQDVTQQVVARRDTVQPEKVEDLIGLDIMIASESSYSERLNKLKEEHPELSWREEGNVSTEQLLYDLWHRKIGCTVADSNIVDMNRRYFPELIAPFNLNRSESLAWMMSAEREDIKKAVTEWFEPYEESGRLAALQEKYYGFFEVFDYVDVRKFIRRISKRFPNYREYFREAAEKYDLPYLLLAAQAYQESHWRATAVSPTGVKGIMMLTLNTAKAMGVTNRLNPRQSIFGGARYLSMLKEERFSEEVKEPDRTWLALAAYNVGRSHLHDAQLLARSQGLDPYHWGDLKQVLPLLSQKRYYENLKYGYARGMEPVRYVQRIREYLHILENELSVRRRRPANRKAVYGVN